MNETIKRAILPELPIVGTLELSSRDGKTLVSIDVVKKQNPKNMDPFFEHCYQELEKFLLGKSQKIKIPLDMSGLTSFQKEVLKVMKEIPYGSVATYKDLAIKLNSRAYQAIGNACGKNPFLLIYPCHRVLGSNNPGGFAHGLKMKKALLELEGVKL